MKRTLSRRELLRALAVTGGGLAAVAAELAVESSHTQAQALTHKVFLPMLKNEEAVLPVTDSTVVQVRNPRAILRNGEWNRSSPNDRFWMHVDQTVVNSMTDAGLRRLTGTNTVTAAWQALLPNYTIGEKIAIKVSFNNTDTNIPDVCNTTHGNIDAVIEPVNALVRGLLDFGVAASDIWIYDAIRVIPNRFKNGNLYPGVRFFSKPDAPTCAGDRTTASNQSFVFSTPSGGPRLDSLPIPTVITNARYLINMPILKTHSSAGFTLGFKNHFGSVTRTPENLHQYFFPASGIFNTYYRSYTPLIDMNRHPQIQGKTILTVGEGLFGTTRSHLQAPYPWSLSNFSDVDFPAMMFFSKDPVAIDCVMADWLTYERPSIDQRTAEYLVMAERAGLGTCERKDPRNPSSYTKINLHNITQS